MVFIIFNDYNFWKYSYMPQLEKNYSHYPTIFFTIPLFFSFPYYPFFILFFIYSVDPTSLSLLHPILFHYFNLMQTLRLSLAHHTLFHYFNLRWRPFSHKADALTRILGFPLSDAFSPLNTCLSFFMSFLWWFRKWLLK